MRQKNLNTLYFSVLFRVSSNSECNEEERMYHFYFEDILIHLSLHLTIPEFRYNKLSVEEMFSSLDLKSQRHQMCFVSVEHFTTTAFTRELLTKCLKQLIF